MAQFNMRTDAVDVEKIMHRIRARIRDKRGIDYTDDEVRELAAVQLERFLDPKAVRSDLVEQYQRRRPPVTFESFDNYAFEDDTIYRSSRGGFGSLVGWCRRLLNPILKLFFNPGPIIDVLHKQSEINTKLAGSIHAAGRQQEARDALNFEIFNNVVVELTKVGIEVKNLKMQIESMSSRLDFDERRARALEGAVQYRPGVTKPEPPPQPTAPATDASDADGEVARPKRRRRRGRRRGSSRSDSSGQPATPAAGGESAMGGLAGPDDDSHAGTGHGQGPDPVTPASMPNPTPATSTTPVGGPSDVERPADGLRGATES